MDLIEKYWQTAYRGACYLKYVPFLRMIGVNGSLAQGKITEQSDIDFLIVADSGRIWTCRALSSMLLQILRMRRNDKHIAGKICLNRYITTDSLVIYPYNFYHAKIYSKSMPILDYKIYDQFFDANQWMNNFIKFEKQIAKKNIANNKHFFRILLEKILSKKVGNILEIFLKKIQLFKIKKNKNTLKKQGLIIATDQMLCFHPTSATNLTKVG